MRKSLSSLTVEISYAYFHMHCNLRAGTSLHFTLVTCNEEIISSQSFKLLIQFQLCELALERRRVVQRSGPRLRHNSAQEPLQRSQSIKPARSSNKLLHDAQLLRRDIPFSLCINNTGCLATKWVNLYSMNVKELKEVSLQNIWINSLHNHISHNSHILSQKSYPQINLILVLGSTPLYFIRVPRAMKRQYVISCQNSRNHHKI